ncbi:KDO2-lipid IV(A) lauroyltransferase [Natronoflexus pectinivorans]|uniref:KDO2-lipid IV(A) lauroyltransferase n=2 Tax=Natronoflexus pectinivorans TaxID=682526 RepID=A0A4R2GLS3_9BACT|nr:KDO2-lipid IV(A) lauroyltransferase [Natronoflexus pectinivorans]
MLNYIGFYLSYPFLWLAGNMPFWILYRFSDFFYIVVLLVGYRKKVIETNLRNSFPEKSNSEIRKIRYSFYRHFCDIFVETIAMQKSNVSRIRKRVRVVNPEDVNAVLEKGQDVIAVTGHYGNWEWVPSVSDRLNALGVSVYRPLKNPMMDKYMLMLRSRFGSVNIPKKNTSREIVRYKRSNQRFILGLISDQSPGKRELQYWTRFLNQNTPVILGPEKLAKLTDSQLFFWQMEKEKRGQYKITFIPYEGNVKDSADYDITEWHLRLLEKLIVSKPEHWLWSHKRWKYQHLFPGKE